MAWFVVMNVEEIVNAVVGMVCLLCFCFAVHGLTFDHRRKAFRWHKSVHDALHSSSLRFEHGGEISCAIRFDRLIFNEHGGESTVIFAFLQLTLA